MNVERSIGRHRIGEWEFLPTTGELRRRADVRRLEPRAAKAVEMLCNANGEVLTMLGPPFSISRTPSAIVAPPPDIGQHTEEVLKEFGYGDQEIAALRQSNAI